jgi:hypothetical protein
MLALGGAATPPILTTAWEYWEAALEAGLTNGTAMSRFTGQVNTRHWAQGTGANQPTYQTNIVNGLPAVRFNGSPRHFTGPDMSALVNVHCFLVVKTDSDPTTSSSTDGLWSVGVSASSDQWSDDAGAHPIRMGAFSNGFLGPFTYSGSLATWRVLEVISQAGVGSPDGRIYRLDGTSFHAGGNTRPTADGPVTPLLGKSVGATYLVGYVAGMYLFSSRLADGGSDRSSMVSYINTKFGLSMV